ATWIRVEPADRTAEDVAAWLYSPDRTDLAYLIVASPPYFRIPLETARAHKDAPPQLRNASGDVAPADTLTLAGSAIADDVALAQTAKAMRPDPDAAHVVERARIQLGFVRNQLASYGLEGALAGAAEFLDRRLADANRDAHGLDRWSAVVIAQERI